MRTTRTRILLVIVVASMVVALFMNWDEVARGYRDGLNGGINDAPAVRLANSTERAHQGTAA